MGESLNRRSADDCAQPVELMAHRQLRDVRRAAARVTDCSWNTASNTYSNRPSMPE